MCEGVKQLHKILFGERFNAYYKNLLEIKENIVQ
jgi:hypothetical protein